MIVIHLLNYTALLEIDGTLIHDVKHYNVGNLSTECSCHCVAKFPA